MQRSPEVLVFATYLAPCLKPLYQLVTDTVGEELGRPTRLVDGTSLDQLRQGEVGFAFLCGLPYVRLRREDPSLVDAIAAPVVSEVRYGGRPIYFSDVIVPRDSPAKAWGDLRGASWAYNEPDSHSGYLVTSPCESRPDQGHRRAGPIHDPTIGGDSRGVGITQEGRSGDCRRPRRSPGTS